MARDLTPIIQAVGVHRRYRVGSGWVHAVAGVDLAVFPGETMALVGESGSGKSTLARVMVYLEPPDRGRVLVHGRDVAAMSRAERARARGAVQMVFQDPSSSLDPRMRIRATLAEPLEIRRVCRTRRELDERIDGLLTMVGLGPEILGRYPHELSGGQKQRVSLARALAVSPEVIVADEPVSALDVSVQAQILNLMMDLQVAEGLAYLFIAHDLALVSQVAHRVAVMYRGMVVEQGEASLVLSRPVHPYTRALVAAMPRPEVPSGRAPFPDAARPEQPEAVTHGCPYWPRCPLATRSCEIDRPTLDARPDGRSVACPVV